MTSGTSRGASLPVRALAAGRGLCEDLVHAHLWLGLGASAQAGLAILIAADFYSGGRDDFVGALLYVPLIGTATIALYGAHRLLGLRRLGEERWAGRWAGIAQRRTLIRRWALGAAATSAVLYAALPFAWQWRILVPGSIGVLYVVPVFSGRRLRDEGLGKVLWLSLGWVGLTTWVPLAAVGDGQPPHSHYSPVAVWLVCGERLLFMLGHSLAFDHRDIAFDLTDGVRTVPSRLGTVASRWMSVTLLCGSAIALGIGLHIGVYRGLTFWPLFATSVLAIALVWKAYAKTSLGPMYFGFVLDGLFAVPGLLVVGFFALLLILELVTTRFR